MNRFAGRNVVVTGASRGIGAALAERFAAEGANVVIVARTVDQHDHLTGSLNETLQRGRRHGARVEAIAADLADPSSRADIVPRALELLDGRMDILVNNAAAAIYMRSTEYPYKRQRIMFEVNVHAPIELVQAVVPGMVERGEGWIVNVSSASAKHAAGPPFRTEGVATSIGLYGSTKAALNRITNAFAVELYGTGVRINTVEPRSAVMSEGAEALVGDIVKQDQIESMEAMVEGTIALCDCPPEHTGRVEVSLDVLDRLGITVMTLDGSRPYPGGQRVAAG
jgi:NAD(P)-dependent dehydrogenase (short-subunit alcohol dehydrogenase family)